MSEIKKEQSSCYCINLRRISNAITKHYDTIMEPVGISITQYSILSNINKFENSTVSDLAIRMGLERTTLVRTLKPLFAKNLIKDISKEGTRKRKLKLTQNGKELLNKANPLWGQAQKTIEENLSIEEIKVLNNIVKKLQNNL